MALQNIINKILEDANTKVKSLLDDANAKAEDILKKAKEESIALSKKILDEANAKSKLDMERAYISKNLEIKKEILKKKRELIDNAFDEAFEAVLKLDNQMYRDMIEKMLFANVTNNEEVEIQFYKNDEQRLWEELIDELNKKMGLNMELAPVIEKDDRGFIARKGKIILNFTFSEGLKALRDKVEFEVSKILFRW